jgi:hypothetical protein
MKYFYHKTNVSHFVFFRAVHFSVEQDACLLAMATGNIALHITDEMSTVSTENKLFLLYHTLKALESVVEHNLGKGNK